MASSICRPVMAVTEKIIHRSVVSTSCRCKGTWKKKLLKREDMKEQVIEYARENARRAERVYVWGCATTGALGIKSYLKPDKKHLAIRKKSGPARLRFADQHDIKVRHVACGYGFTVFSARTPQGHHLFGTGINTNSQIGYHESPRGSGRVLDTVIQPVQIALPLATPDTTRVTDVSCGRVHTAVVTDKEGVFSMGNNSCGQCGRGIVEGEVYSKNTTVNKIEALPDDVTQVVCGQDHTLFLTESGQVYSCGLGADGQTGLGHYTNVSSPTLVKGDVEGEKIVSVASTADCVLAVSEKGDLFGWGNSEYNQLSMVTNHAQLATPTHLPVPRCGRIVKAATGGSICAVLNDRGEVFVWGFGILGKGPNLEAAVKPEMIPSTLFGRNELQESSKVKDIVCGLGHFVALTDTGHVYSWGKNREDCLGLVSSGDQFFPLKVSLPAEAHTIRCGVDHTVVLCRSFT